MLVAGYQDLAIQFPAIFDFLLNFEFELITEWEFFHHFTVVDILFH